jgi:hypothetical protein
MTVIAAATIVTTMMTILAGIASSQFRFRENANSVCPQNLGADAFFTGGTPSVPAQGRIVCCPRSVYGFPAPSEKAHRMGMTISRRTPLE